MRAPSLRLLAALAVTGALTAGTLTGCGKGSDASSSRTSAGTGSVPGTSGVVGISTKNTTRLGGADAADDAAEVARAVFPGLTPATRPQAVVLVDEHNWPAALAASSLAGAPLGAPLLFADGGSLPDASSKALSAMHPIGAATLGGAKVLEVGTSANVPDGLLARSVVVRGGPATYAVAILKQFQATHGARPHEVLVVASDAPRALQMPAAALSAESGAPILFVERARVPAATTAALKALRHPAIYVVAPTTLSKRTYAELAPLGDVVHVSGGAGADETTSARASGNAVDNAISVSRFSHGSFGWGIHEAGHGLVFANVSRPLDAPAAAPLAAHGDYGPLLLLDSRASVPAALTQYLSDIEPGYTAAAPPVREVYNHGWLIGDEQAISALAQAELDTVLEIAPRQPSAAEQSVAAAE
jgi:hypothetical protein